MKIVIITFNFHGRKGKLMKRKEYLTEINAVFAQLRLLPFWVRVNAAKQHLPDSCIKKSDAED